MTQIEAVKTACDTLTNKKYTFYISEKDALAAIPCVVLIPYGGSSNNEIKSLNTSFVQISVYSNSMETAYSNSQAVYESLENVCNYAVNSEYFILSISLIQPPFFLDSVEEKNGSLYRVVFNAYFYIRKRG